MTSFNDITKGLENTGNTRAEAEALAKKLVEQGIAPTMMEAREQAKSMVATEKEVTRDQSKKEKDLTTYNDPRNNPNYNKYRAAMVEEFRNRALSKNPVKIQDEFQTPRYERKNKAPTSAEMATPQTKEPAKQPETPTRPQSPKRDEKPAEEQPRPRPEPAPQAKPEERATTSQAQEDAPTQEPEEQERSAEEPKARKDLAKEAGIDINDIFNSAKK